MPEAATAAPGAAATRERDRIGSLRLEGVSRRFGGQWALEKLDLTIQGGEFIALLGPSGSGKSTALNCLAGLLPLSDGRIWLDDRRLDGLPPEKRGFGMVFQSYALFPHMTVRRNVAFGLTMRGRGKAEIERRVAAALDLVQLGDHADKLPAQLSGGEQQRVAIARAIVFEPPVVLMDEPLSNLDAKLRLELRTEVRRLHQSLDLTTVYVTHDQQEALSLADRVVILRGGRVQQIGTPNEVYTTPASPFVAGFIGYRNLFELGVERRQGAEVTLAEDGLRLHGRVRGELRGPRALVALRPEDFALDEPGETGNRLEVTAEVAEYGGREFAVQAVTPAGRTLHFLTRRHVRPGERVVLTVAPDRVLVFPPDEEA